VSVEDDSDSAPDCPTPRRHQPRHQTSTTQQDDIDNAIAAMHRAARHPSPARPARHHHETVCRPMAQVEPANNVTRGQGSTHDEPSRCSNVQEGRHGSSWTSWVVGILIFCFVVGLGLLIASWYREKEVEKVDIEESKNYCSLWSSLFGPHPKCDDY
jgi:hypothetical protein